MNFSELTAQKTQARDAYKSSYSFPRRSKILIGVHFTDASITQEILDGLSILPANFIVFGDENRSHEGKNLAFETSHEGFDMTGIDAMLCNCEDTKLEKIMEL
jgi:hypothetical protein